MNSLEPLFALLSQTERERDAALAESQRCAQTLEAARAQAEQLVAYRRDYEQRYAEKFRQEGGMELMHVYRAFMDRLNLAVDQQQRVAQHAAVKAEQAREALVQRELRVASVRKLIERRQHEMRASAERRDQKQTDEFAARAAHMRMSLLGADGVRLF